MQMASDAIRAEGETIGLAKGRDEGRVQALILVLETRFGELPEEIRQRIQTAGAPCIDRWIVKSPSAPTLDKVINGYDDDD